MQKSNIQWEMKMKKIRFEIQVKNKNIFKDNRSYKTKKSAQARVSSLKELYYEDFRIVEVEIVDDLETLKAKEKELNSSIEKLSKSLLEVLSYGSPKPDENPTMFVAWEKAHKVLSELAPDSILSN